MRTKNNKGVHKGTVNFDYYKHVIELSAYDLDGHLTPFLGDTIAIQRWRYDEPGTESRRPTRRTGSRHASTATLSSARSTTNADTKSSWPTSTKPEGRRGATNRSPAGSPSSTGRARDPPDLLRHRREAHAAQGRLRVECQVRRLGQPKRAGLLRPRREADKHQRLRGRPLEVRRAREHHRCRLPR